MILLDTHVVIWLALDPERLSQKARAAIDKARERAEGLRICDITLLEAATLSRKRQVSLKGDLQSFLTEIETRFVVLPITARACARTVALPATFPKDPVDRIIAATALVEGLQLVTADKAIRGSRALPTIW